MGAKAVPQIEFRPDSPPKTADAEKNVGFQAGPMMGGKPIQPQQAMGEATVKIPSTSKCLIFVVDLQDAKSLDDEPKKLQEMKEDITDALGVTTPDQFLQVVFAGYHGPMRTGIESDQELNDFFKQNIGTPTGEKKIGEEGQPQPKSNTRSRRSELMAQTAKEMNCTMSELTRLRLGGVITKIQMRKYVRQFHEAKTALDEKTVELENSQKKYAQLEACIPGKIQIAVNDATSKLEAKMKLEHEKHVKEVISQKNKEMEGKIRPLKQDIVKLKEEIETKKKQLTETIKERDQFNECFEEQKRKTAFAFEQLDMERLRHEEEKEAALLEGADDAANVEILEENLEKLERRFQRASQILLENGLEVPGEDDSGAASGEATPVDALSFVWRVPDAAKKLDAYLPGRSLQSREFQLGDMEESFVAEFYPNGVEMSASGMCSLRLRPPNNTRVDWNVFLGQKPVGRRQDEFNEDNWWTRQGILWAGFASSSMAREQIEKKDGALVIKISATRLERLPGFSSPATPVSNLPRLPMRLTPPPPSIMQIVCPEPQVLIGQIEVKFKGQDVLDPALLSWICEYLNKQRPNSKADSKLAFSKLEDAFGLKGVGGMFQIKDAKAGHRGSDITQLPNAMNRRGIGQAVLRPCSSEGSLGALSMIQPKGKLGANTFPGMSSAMNPGSRSGLGNGRLPPTR